jgi:uncharacterized protein (DUF2062 family)
MDETRGAAPAGQVRRTWSAQLIERIARCDTPHRTAAAFAGGVFLSFSPFLGFQMIVGMSLAILFRLSKASVFAGLCTNLPWFMIPWYTLTTVAAAATLGTPIGPEVRLGLTRLTQLSFYSSAFWTNAREIVAPFFWSFLIGSTIGAIIVAVGAYVVVVRIVSRIQAVPAPSGDLVTELNSATSD